MEGTWIMVCASVWMEMYNARNDSNDVGSFVLQRGVAGLQLHANMLHMYV